MILLNYQLQINDIYIQFTIMFQQTYLITESKYTPTKENVIYVIFNFLVQVE